MNPNRGFFLLLLSVAIGSCFLHIPFFYHSPHVSQSLFSLLFLNLAFLFFLFCDRQKRIEISLPLLTLFLAAVLVALSFKNDATVLAFLGLYLLCLTLLSITTLRRHVVILLAYTALISAIYSLGLYVAAKLGLSLAATGRLSGNYGQANLMATLMLMGLFSHFQILSSTGRKHLLYLVPALVMAVVLFMTASRGGLLALCCCLLLVLAFRRNEQVKRLTPYFIHLFVVVVIAWGIAQLAGEWTPLSRAGDSWSDDSGTYARLVYWVAAILMGGDNLLTGTGFGGYARNLGDYTIQSVQVLHLPYDLISQTLWAHNDFLHIFAEHGLLVFLVVLSFAMMLIVRFYKQKSHYDFFAFLVIFSFMCMMCFSHPLYFHNLTLMACLAFAPLLGRWRGKNVFISKKLVMPIVVLFLVFINYFVVMHCFQMHNLHNFRQYMITAESPFAERFKTAESLYLKENKDNSVYGWRFKHTLYTNLVDKIHEIDDQDLARHVLGEMTKYFEENHFSSYAFTLAKLHFILGDYEKSKYYADFAFQRDPYEDKYFALLHLCNALIISKENNININKLLPLAEIEKLKEEKVFLPRQFSSDGIAL